MKQKHAYADLIALTFSILASLNEGLSLHTPYHEIKINVNLMNKIVSLQGNSNISGSAHLGGAAVAALAWARITRRWF